MDYRDLSPQSPRSALTSGHRRSSGRLSAPSPLQVSYSPSRSPVANPGRESDSTDPITFREDDVIERSTASNTLREDDVIDLSAASNTRLCEDEVSDHSTAPASESTRSQSLPGRSRPIAIPGSGITRRSSSASLSTRRIPSDPLPEKAGDSPITLFSRIRRPSSTPMYRDLPPSTAHSSHPRNVHSSATQLASTPEPTSSPSSASFRCTGHLSSYPYQGSPSSTPPPDSSSAHSLPSRRIPSNPSCLSEEESLDSSSSFFDSTAGRYFSTPHQHFHLAQQPQQQQQSSPADLSSRSIADPKPSLSNPSSSNSTPAAKMIQRRSSLPTVLPSARRRRSDGNEFVTRRLPRASTSPQIGRAHLHHQPKLQVFFGPDGPVIGSAIGMDMCLMS